MRRGVAVDLYRSVLTRVTKGGRSNFVLNELRHHGIERIENIIHNALDLCVGQWLVKGEFKELFGGCTL